MFSFFKPKPPPVPAEPTYKTRVQQFWDWYTEVAARFYQTIEAGQSASLAPEVSAKVDESFPGFAWVFGPGANNQGHSFTLSGEGDLHRQLLTQFWLTLAPSLPGWTFYAARQPTAIQGQRININDHVFNPIEFWLTPVVNQEKQKLDITVWHPMFDQMPERQRWTVLFLFLDQVLGEYGTGQWVGEIKLEPKRLADSIPLEELRDFTQKVQTEHGWKKLPPGESSAMYRPKEQHTRYLRGDIVTGTTMHLPLLNQYLKGNGELADPLKGTGADYVFVAFDAKILPAGKQVAVRGATEDALDVALRTAASGRLLGGALGTQNAYIDLLLFDGSRSVDLVLRTLRERNLPDGTSLNYFAKEKRGQRRAL